MRLDAELARTGRSASTTSAGVPASPFSRSSAGSRPIARPAGRTRPRPPRSRAPAPPRRPAASVAAGRLAARRAPGRTARRVSSTDRNAQVELGRRSGPPAPAYGVGPPPPMITGGRGAAPASAGGGVGRAGSACRRSENCSPTGRVPQPGDDLELLLEAVEALADGGERDAVRVVLAPRTSRRRGPARPGRRSSRRPAPPRSRAGPGSRNVAGRHQRAEPDRGGLPGEPGEGDPGVGRPGQPVRRPSRGSGRSGRRRRTRGPPSPGDGEQLLVAWRPAGAR